MPRWYVPQPEISASRQGPTGDKHSVAFPVGRSRGVTVAVDGFFAFVWFGWGQASAPSWLVIPLAVGTTLGFLLAVTGVVVTRRSTGELPAASDPAVRRRYGIIVGLEFGLLGAGAGVLGGTGYSQWIPVWICFGVGADRKSTRLNSSHVEISYAVFCLKK